MRLFSSAKQLTRRFSSSTFNKTQFYEPSSSKPRLVLAYSGGLDTSCQLNYLVNEKGFEVCAYIADLGQSDLTTEAEKEAVKEKAMKSGAYAFYCEDLKEDLINNYVLKMLSSSSLYEGRYLLGTSIARPCIAKRQVEICAQEDAGFISHGSTGKGNDQVRFELAYLCLNPKLQPITLWRDPEYCEKFQGRADLQKYASEKNIIASSEKTNEKRWAYSEDENCLHISFESGELEDVAFPANTYGKGSEGIEYPGEIFKKKMNWIKETPDSSDVLKISFDKGIPTSVTNLTSNETVNGSVDLFFYLNELAGKHGVGRIDIVENRFVGMKSRGCYETPAGTVLFSAHQDLEVLTMDREVMRIRDGLSLKYAELVYNGYWFSPEMSFLKKIVEESQEVVSGDAYVELFKGNVLNVGRESSNSLYDESLVSMDEHGGYDPTNATGFIRTLATRLKAVKNRDDKLGKVW
eukprot:maker-scaffold_2-snap-gene-27.6-mRNA-1 protein AED:0.01 eAED:0.01 QI:349/1/1/1/1/1/2/285/463